MPGGGSQIFADQGVAAFIAKMTHPTMGWKSLVGLMKPLLVGPFHGAGLYQESGTEGIILFDQDRKSSTSGLVVTSLDAGAASVTLHPELSKHDPGLRLHRGRLR
jgi:hypothetical protein